MVLVAIIMIISSMQALKKPVLLLLIPLAMAWHCKKSANNPGPGGPVGIRDSVIVEGLNYPWEILWGPDQFIWMTERGGRISRVNPATGVVSPLITISEVVSSGEGGLLGMVLHPDFTNNPHVFVVYNYNSPNGYREKLVRYTYNGSSLVNPTPLLTDIDAASIHNGSRLLIINNKLFISTGDASNTTSPQNTSSVNGKILRLNLDGSIPADNPEAGKAYWSYGHRNAQGLVYANNRLYSSEHGPNSDDEVNIIEKGKNYGWPNVRGYCDESSEQSFCQSTPVVEPIKAWTPTIATCGLDYYNSDHIPQWKGSLLLVALKDARLYQMKLDASFTSITETNEYFRNDHGRMRDLCISLSGKVYICTSNGGNSDVIVEVRGE